LAVHTRTISPETAMSDVTPAPRSHEPTISGVVTRPILVGYDGSAPSRHALAYAADTRADAIVLGAPARWVHRIAGSVPVWLTRHARCPVVIVP